MNSIYRKPLRPDTVRERAERARALLSPCRLCPRRCGAVRDRGERGECKIGDEIIVSSVMPHHGEEDCLSGTRGSGTVFFAGCNLECVYCQNYDISQELEGKSLSIEELARALLYVQEIGCHNLNLVTPTHVIAQILESLTLAVEGGFRLPIVYNCGGYESVETLELLDGIVDIYMPDFKYWDNTIAKKFSGVDRYADFARSALQEMHRQVGDLFVNEEGLAVRGLLVRHLVLPNGLAGTQPIMKFLAEEISTQTYVNVMGQYRPCYRAAAFETLRRGIDCKEMMQAKKYAIDVGLYRFDR